MERWAVFGGVFDPPHLGHRQAVEFVLANGGVSRVVVIPAFEAPHKERAAASFDERVAMCQILFSELAGQGCVVVSQIESSLEAPSYSYRTWNALREANAAVRLFPVVGWDNYINLKSWKRVDEVLAYRFIVLARGAGFQGEAPNVPSYLAGRDDVVLNNPLWPHSSSEVKRRIREGGGSGLEELVGREVKEYILGRGLYQ